MGTGIIAAGNFVEGNLEFLDNILKNGKGVVEEVKEVAETVEHVVEESKVVVEEVEAVVEDVKEVEDTVEKDLDESIEVVKVNDLQCLLPSRSRAMSLALLPIAV